jgi:hypothetical protein
MCMVEILKWIMACVEPRENTAVPQYETAHRIQFAKKQHIGMFAALTMR